MEPAGDRGCPPRPSSDADVDFQRRPMVRWLDPHQLLDTVARVVASGFLSSYTDNRELQALWPCEVHDRSKAEELWFDYVSDLGDGWNPTYTVARLLAREKLELDGEGGAPHVLERGRILVMGGDLVYPVPKRVEYQNRLLGPYRSAMPCSPNGEPPPELFAIPGSHDWYDGLVNFTSLLCRQRTIGGWTTCQSRSYFALALPHRWWLWAIDLQFGEHLDEGQLRYFIDAASQMREGDQIVLCMSKEVVTGRKSADVMSDRTLVYLEREVIGPAGGRIVLYLKSGRHFYCRYQERGTDRSLITAGGGGAFLHPTHQLPPTAHPHRSGAGDYELQASYPSPATSRRLRKRIFLLPAYNLPLAAFFGAVQVLLAVMIGLHKDGAHRGLSFEWLVTALWESPTAFLMMGLMVVSFAAMVRFAHDAKGIARLLIGLGHSSFQFVAIAAVLVVASRLTGFSSVGPASTASFFGLVLVLGGLGGAVGLAAYLWAANCAGLHGNEVYAPLHHPNHKCFLRLHIGGSGDLTVYPVGVERAGRRWRYAPEGAPSDPWLEPVGTDPPAHLLESPIRIPGPGSATPG